jgi:CHAT domain-containing protein
MVRVCATIVLMLAFALQIAAGRADEATAAPTDEETTARSDFIFGDYEGAREMWKHELADAVRRKDDVSQSYFLNSIGSASEALEQYDDALRAFGAALNLDRKDGMLLNQVDDLRNLGVLEYLMGRYDDALRAHNEDLALAQQLKNGVDVAHAQINIGNIYSALGHYEDALREYTAALQTYHEQNDAYGTENAGEGNAHLDIGETYRELGRFPLALTELEMASALHKGTCAQNKDLLDIAGVQALSGKYSEALGTARNALEGFRSCGDEEGEGYAYQNIAYVEARFGDTSQAEGARESGFAGLRIARELNLADLRWKSTFVIAQSDTKLPLRRDEAVAQFEATLDAIEELRTGLPTGAERETFLLSKMFAYDAFIAYLRDLYVGSSSSAFAAKALAVLERKNARVLLEQIGWSSAHRFSSVPPAIVDAEDDADLAVEAQRNSLEKLSTDPTRNEGAIANAEERLRQNTQRLEALERSIERSYPEYFTLRHPQPVDVGSLQRTVLSRSDVVLVYDLLPDQSVLWVISKTRLQLFTLPSEATLELAIQRVRTHIATIQSEIASGALNSEIEESETNDIAGFASDAYALWKALVPDAARPLIEEAGRLIIVPSGELYQVPWEALVTKPPVADATPQYLVEQHAISYVSSVSLLSVVRAVNQNRARATEPLLAFARPQYGPSAAKDPTLEYDAVRSALNGVFGDLPGTQAEAAAVRDALHAPASSVFLGEKASKSTLFGLNATGALRRYRYVLFATHAVLPDASEGISQPALVLAHPDRDGLLTMSDVFQLSLNADFVSLSACNTGVGLRRVDEGIGGLTRAFLFAGTPAVSVTLWNVDDSAAPTLSGAFFKNMREGAAPDEALRQAKLAMIHSPNPRLRHPFAWAPSVIFGDGAGRAGVHRAQ